MNEPLTNQSIIYTYGMFVLHASRKLMFFAGTIDYHNLVLIGLSEMEEQGCLHIDWSENDSNDKGWDKDQSKDERSSATGIVLTKSSRLPEHLSIFEDIYHRIPDTGITVEKLLQDIYLVERNEETTDLQQKLINGMRERGMLTIMEKKGLFHKTKKILTVNETLWQTETNRLSLELNQATDSANPNLLPLSSFMLADLLCRGNMLPDLFGKRDSRYYWEQIVSLNEQSKYKDLSFSRLLSIVREIEPDLFNLISFDCNGF